ncbi:hypothetical protein Sjap_001690 [Stephania japonica]|uniref:E3 UFM1-protein ligase 1 homolog n=1 Tax=Stephania japonica TaxID=461633 RepID=A0AAP0PTI3_9MAGN
MDAELLELQRQFELAQEAKSSVRLSERNVVELVQKLHDIQIIDYDLLHTVSGKEYITSDQLRCEMMMEIDKSGRVSLIELADVVGVDLYHIEKQAQCIVVDGSGLMLIQGEIIAQSYWDNVAEEINDRLQESSQIALAELAAQLNVGSELLTVALEPRLGSIVKGRLEGGQLYTPAYVARVTAMVRGATRAITVPMNLSFVWSSLQQQLQENNGTNSVAVEGSFFQSLFNGLVKEVEILGSIRAGVHWTPAVFAHAQRESVDSFFSQNTYIAYEALHKLGIPQPKKYLQSRYPEGVPLDTVFIHPSMIDMLDSAAEDAIEHGHWIDSLSVLPALFGSQDASMLLSLCPSVQRSVKAKSCLIFGHSYGSRNLYMYGMKEPMEKEIETISYSKSLGQGPSGNSNITSKTKVTNDSDCFAEVGIDGSFSKPSFEKGSKKKKGKAAGNTKTGQLESGPVEIENLPAKGKKNQRKSKETSSFHLSDTKSGAKKDPDKTKEDDDLIISEEWIMKKIMTLVADFEDQGGLDDPHSLVAALAFHLRPMLLTSWKEKRKALLMENADKMKRLLNNLQKKLDEAFLNMQLYEKALDLFEDDPSTSLTLHRHLLRTTGSSIVDMILVTLDMHNKLKNGVEVKDSKTIEDTALSAADRMSLAKSLPGSLSVKAISVVEALDAKQVETFMTALRDLADESGLLLKKLDKKLEKSLLHSYRKELASQVSTEMDAVAVLPKVVSLIYLQVYNKALQAPGRAISAAVARLKDKLEDSAHKVLSDYHKATVSVLALQAAAPDDEESCSADRIMSKRELLESLKPELKRLVLSAA